MNMFKWLLVLCILPVCCAAALNNVDINVLDYVGGMDESDTSPEISISLLNATNTRSLSQRQSGRFLCILTRVTPHICNYGVYTYFVQSVYAARHGYLMLPLLPDSSVPDYAYHRKLQPLIEALDTYSSICAYVVWLDSDLIPLDQTLDLQNKLSLYPDIDIMASRDVSTLINTGCLLVRNTAWSLGFLKTWHACRLETGAHNEQLGFHCAYNQYTEEESHRKIAILTDHELNSIAPAMHTLLPSHPILHLAAEDNAYRHRVFKLAAQNMLDALKQGSSIPIQLGISRVVLQETAILEYEGIYKEAYATIQTHLQLPVISNIDMDVLERYRMAVSKYCFATEYYQSDLAIPLDHVHLVSVRSEAYETLRSLMCLYIMIVLSDTNRQAVYGMPSQEIVSMVMGILIASTDTGHTSHIHPLAAQLIMTSNQFDELSRVIFQSLPEIAKLTVELAYDLLRSYVDIVPNSSDDVSELVREIHSVLVLLRHTVHPKQVSMVDKMLIEFETFVRHTGDLSD